MCRSTSSRCESHCPCSRSSEQNVSCWSAWWSWISVPGVGYLTPSSSLHHLFSIAGGHPAHAQRLCCASVIGASSLAPRSHIGWPCALAKGTSHCSCRTDGKRSPLSLKCWTVFIDIVRFICNHRVACGAPHFTGIALHHYTEAHHRAPHRTAQHQTTPQHTTAHHSTPHHSTPHHRAPTAACSQFRPTQGRVDFGRGAFCMENFAVPKCGEITPKRGCEIKRRSRRPVPPIF